MNSELTIISGPSDADLSKRLCQERNAQYIGTEVLRNPSGEITGVRITQQVDGGHVYIIQPAAGSINESFMVAAMIADAAKKNGAERVILVAQHFFYPNRDRNEPARTSVTLRLAVDLLKTAGVDCIVAMDFHNRDAVALLPLRIINMRGAGLLAEAIKSQWVTNGEAEPRENWQISDVIGVASSFGEAMDIARATRLLDIPRVVIDRPKGGTPELMGRSVEGKHCLIIDDAVRTGETGEETTRFLLDQGAQSVRLVTTHLPFPTLSLPRLLGAGIKHVMAVRTVPIDESLVPEGLNLHVVDPSRLLSEVIMRHRRGENIEVLWGMPLSRL